MQAWIDVERVDPSELFCGVWLHVLELTSSAAIFA
jgi:hypothetical protein